MTRGIEIRSPLLILVGAHDEIIGQGFKKE
jgi:hypothetical protein